MILAAEPRGTVMKAATELLLTGKGSWKGAMFTKNLVLGNWKKTIDMDYVNRGSFAKFKCEIVADGFSMGANDFGIYLLWGMRGQKMSIEKADMTRNDDGDWFFSFDTTDMFGPIRAVCWYWTMDSDGDDMHRHESNAVSLCVVRSKDACSVDDGMVDDGCGCPAHYSNRTGGCSFGIWLCASEEERQSGDDGGGSNGE